MNANGGAGVTMHHVTSSNILGVGRDGEDLIVSFRTGRPYRFAGAGGRLADILEVEKAKESVGKWLNAEIKGKYPATKEP